MSKFTRKMGGAAKVMYLDISLRRKSSKNYSVFKEKDGIIENQGKNVEPQGKNVEPQGKNVEKYGEPLKKIKISNLHDDNLRDEYNKPLEFSPTDVGKQNKFLKEVKNDFIKLNADNKEKEKMGNDALNGLKQCVDYSSSELSKQQEILNEINKIREGMKI